MKVVEAKYTYPNLKVEKSNGVTTVKVNAAMPFQVRATFAVPCVLVSLMIFFFSAMGGPVYAAAGIALIALLWLAFFHYLARRYKLVFSESGLQYKRTLYLWNDFGGFHADGNGWSEHNGQVFGYDLIGFRYGMRDKILPGVQTPGSGDDIANYLNRLAQDYRG